MKVYEIQNRTGLDALTLAERPEPKPAHGHVLVKIHAASLNYRDLMIAGGTYGPRADPPVIALSDGAGEVAGIGEGVTRVKVGDRVAGIFIQTHIAGVLTEEKRQSALGGSIDGILAEYVSLNEDGVVVIPEHLSYEEAATLPCAAVTAWNGLITSGKLQTGETVLVQGTGGVSLFALQIAKAAGARVIITSSSDEKLNKARALGADDTINYRTDPGWDIRALELTGGVGVDHVVDVGGPATINQSLRAVRCDGRISVIGVLTGVAGEINIMDMIRKNVNIQGISIGSREMFEAMNRSIAQNKLHPVIDRVFPFSETRDAYEYLQSGKHFGKVVIRVAD